MGRNRGVPADNSATKGAVTAGGNTPRTPPPKHNERKKPVRLMIGGLSGSVYAITNYTETSPDAGGRTQITATTKHDVTKDFFRCIFEYLEDHTLKASDGRKVVIVEATEESA